MRGLLMKAAVFGLLLPGVAFADTLDAKIDFENEGEGCLVTTLFGDSVDGDAGPVDIDGKIPSVTGNRALIFNSDDPTGGDIDLGTPHDDFGGPGIGLGGDIGSEPNVNDTAMGHILVFAENVTDDDADGKVDDPDDANVQGMVFTFDFSGITKPFSVETVTMRAITILDVEKRQGEDPVEVILYDANGDEIDSFSLGETGDNGVRRVLLGVDGTEGVAKMKVILQGSGAIDDIEFTMCGGTPDIDIRKQAEGDDSRDFEVGDDVTWEIKVTNTGDVDLINVEVKDVLEPNCDKVIGNLAAGASFTYECTSTDVQAGYTNEACVEGEAPDGTIVKDCDPSTIVVPTTCCPLNADGKRQRPEILILEYSGGDCDATDTDQATTGDKVKAGCEDFDDLTDCVHILVRSKKKDKKTGDHSIYFEGDVNLGDEFDADATGSSKGEFESETEIIITDKDTGDTLQTIFFHTSCSQPLFSGDVYGGVTVVGCDNGDGGTPPPGGGGGDDLCDNADGKDKLQTIVLEYTADDCDASSHSQPTTGDKPKAGCDDVDTLTDTVTIIVGSKKDKDDKKFVELFNDTVSKGDEFDVTASDKLPNTLYIWIEDGSGNVLQTVFFHTSCSQPLNVKDQFGSIKINGGTSQKGVEHP